MMIQCRILLAIYMKARLIAAGFIH